MDRTTKKSQSVHPRPSILQTPKLDHPHQTTIDHDDQNLKRKLTDGTSHTQANALIFHRTTCATNNLRNYSCSIMNNRHGKSYSKMCSFRTPRCSHETNHVTSSVQPQNSGHNSSCSGSSSESFLNPGKSKDNPSCNSERTLTTNSLRNCSPDELQNSSSLQFPRVKPKSSLDADIQTTQISSHPQQTAKLASINGHDILRRHFRNHKTETDHPATRCSNQSPIGVIEKDENPPTYFENLRNIREILTQHERSPPKSEGRPKSKDKQYSPPLAGKDWTEKEINLGVFERYEAKLKRKDSPCRKEWKEFLKAQRRNQAGQKIGNYPKRVVALSSCIGHNRAFFGDPKTQA